MGRNLVETLIGAAVASEGLLGDRFMYGSGGGKAE